MMLKPVLALAAAAGLAALAMPSGRAEAGILGSDSQACTARSIPAIKVNITGLKDRSGELKLELYPATPDDWLKSDSDLIKQGKVFRRVVVPTPAGGNVVTMCIRPPGPGRYALLMTHNRDGKNKFSIWSDGAGVPSNEKIGRAKPKLADAVVDVGNGMTVTNITTQYLRGLSGFGPSN